MIKKTFFAITIDPLHIGSGGYRLGRVDNTIFREPGSNLPKVPGTSISGVCRNFAIYQLEEDEKNAALLCVSESDPLEKNNCGSCVICQTFGFASRKKKKSQIGKVKFFDASLLAFPVSTMVGPVWVSTSAILRSHGVEFVDCAVPGDEELVINFSLPAQDEEAMHLNLGWLYLPCRKAEFSLPSSATSETEPSVSEIDKRLVLAPEWLFTEIVNSNLEVRTSVSIDFKTGAADSGKLFTYEAIPRAALLAFDIVYDNFRCSEDFPVTKVKEIVHKGLQFFEYLGLGGMNTRGFGRMKIINPDTGGA